MQWNWKMRICLLYFLAEIADKRREVCKRYVNRYDVTPQGLVKSEGNTVIFLGDKYPFNPKGFKVINDNAEGKALWQKARQDWIDRHPYVGRVDGDPPAKPFIQM